MKRKTFHDLLSNLAPLKVLTPDTKLPYVFDLLWDAKTLKDLKDMGRLDNKDVRRKLAENGFDLSSL